MLPTPHRQHSAIDVLNSTIQFLKTIDQLEIDLDDLRISETILSTMIDHSTFFQEDYIEQLEEIRDLAGACIVQACKKKNIPGLCHWSDNHPDPLASNYQQFQRQYAEFLSDVRETVKDIEVQADEELTQEDQTALYGLTAHLASPLMLAKAYATAQQSLDVTTDASFS